MGAKQGLCWPQDLGPRCHGLLRHRLPRLSFVLLPVFLRDLAQPSLLLTCLCSKELPPGSLWHRW